MSWTCGETVLEWLDCQRAKETTMAGKKNATKKKKLTLDKETVKTLTDKDLEGVAGGIRPGGGGGHGVVSAACNITVTKPPSPFGNVSNVSCIC
jgi:hypothetical protein